MEIQDLYKIFLQHPCVTTDSRNCPEGSIFIALKGESFDGNRFAAQALEKGCAYAFVDDPEFVGSDSRIILVDNGLKCLQQLAGHHRRQLARIPVIGITGTNGKTSTKELIANVLMQEKKVLYTQGNLNNHIGVPLTLLQLNGDHDVAIIEMGANHPGEIKTLVNIAQPDYGLITNVGKAHLAGFGSFEGVIRTKGELYDYLREHQGTAFINRANSNLTKIAKGLKLIAYDGKSASCDTCTHDDTCPEAEVWGECVSCSPFLELRWHCGEESHCVKTRLIGSYNLENVLAAVCVGKTFGIDSEAICRAIESYRPSNNRSQCVNTGDNTLIIDAYNANPTSMNAALDNFLPMQCDGPKALILGGMRELGDYSRAEHRRILERIAASGVRLALLVGPEFQADAQEVLSSDKGLLFECFDDSSACRKYLETHPLKAYTVLLKGSHSNRLDLLTDLF